MGLDLWRGGVLLGRVDAVEPDRWDATTLTGVLDPAPGWAAVAELFAAELLHLRWADRDQVGWDAWQLAVAAAREANGSSRPVFLRVSDGRVEVRARRVSET